MSQMISQKSGTLTAANATIGTVGMLNPDVTALISGTFVGTVALQASPTGAAPNWSTIGTPLTAPGIIQASHLAGDLQFQLVCTAFTSGTINGYVAACPSS